MASVAMREGARYGVEPKFHETDIRKANPDKIHDLLSSRILGTNRDLQSFHPCESLKSRRVAITYLRAAASRTGERGGIEALSQMDRGGTNIWAESEN
jgi:hypothetical protein